MPREVTSESELSKGALRAAKIIDAKVLRFETREIESRPIEWLAEIVDECTAHRLLLETLKRLTARLKLIHSDDRYMRVWTLAMLHGETYDGPNYEVELAEAEAAIKQAG